MSSRFFLRCSETTVGVLAPKHVIYLTGDIDRMPRCDTRWTFKSEIVGESVDYGYATLDEAQHAAELMTHTKEDYKANRRGDHLPPSVGTLMERSVEIVPVGK